MRQVCGGPWINHFLKTSRKVRMFATDLDLFHADRQHPENSPRSTDDGAEFYTTG
jgi:hypothetical protein